MNFHDADGVTIRTASIDHNAAAFYMGYANSAEKGQGFRVAKS